MTAKTPMALLKAQLNIIGDHDDALLAHKLAAAEAWIAKYTGDPLPDPVPADVTEAVLMLAAHWYEAREAVSFASPFAIPFGVHDLLSSHKRVVVGHGA